MNKESERICALSNAFGCSGMEDEVTALAREDMRSVARLEEDTMRNLYMYLQETGKPQLLLDAHSDEVGFIIQAIRPDGMCTFLPIGGFQPAHILSSPVTILTRDRKKISGIVGAIPIHYQKNAVTSFEDLFIDPGTCSAAGTRALGIRPGDFVVPDVKCRYDMERGVYAGKAFDCRIGCAALLETMHRLKDQELDVDLIGLLSSQEEVGERGIQAAMQKIHPAAAICFEGCPADDTFQPDWLIQSGLKKGPMLRHYDRSMITSPRFMDFAAGLAEKNHIPVQFAVRQGGGTNGGVLHLHDIPTIVIGIPVRYAHSSCCYAAHCDYEHAVELAVLCAQHLNASVLKSF